MAENEAEKLQKQISFLTSLISAHRNIHGNQPARYAGPHRDHNPSTTSYSNRSHSTRPPGNKKWVRPGIQTGEHCRAATHHPSTLTQGSQESHHRPQGKGTAKTESGKHPLRQGASATTSGVAISKASKSKEREHCSSVHESSNIVNNRITNAVPATNRKLVKSKTLHDEKALGVKPSPAIKPSDSGTKPKPATKLPDPSVKTGNDRKAFNTVIKPTSGGNVLDPGIKLRKETKVKDSRNMLSKDTKTLVSEPGNTDEKNTRTSAHNAGLRSDPKALETKSKSVKDLKTLDCDIEHAQETKNLDPNIAQKEETSSSDPGFKLANDTYKALDPSIPQTKGKKTLAPGSKLREINPVSVGDDTSFKEHIPQEDLKSTPQDPLSSKHSVSPAEKENPTSSSGTLETNSKTLPQTSTPHSSVNTLQANSALKDLSQKESIDISSQSIKGVEKMIPASVIVPGTSSKENELVINEQSGVNDPRETGDVLASTEGSTTKKSNSFSIKEDSVQNPQMLFVSDKSTSGMRKVLAVHERKPKVSEPQSGVIESVILSHDITPPEIKQVKPSGTRTVLLPADLSSKSGTLSSKYNVLGSNSKTGSNQGKQNSARKVIPPASVSLKQTSCSSVDDDLVQKLPQGAGKSKPPQLGKSLGPKIDQPGSTTSKASQQGNSLDPARVDVPSEEKLKSKDMGKCTVVTTSKTKPSLTSKTRVLSTTDADTSGRKGTKDNTEDALPRTSIHASKLKAKVISDSKLSTKDTVQTKSDLSENGVSEKPNLSPIRPPTGQSKITPSIPEKALGKNDVKKVLGGEPGKIIPSTISTVSPITQKIAGVTKSANRTVLAQSDPSGFQQNVHPMKKLVPSRYVWVAKKKSALDLPPRSALSKRNVKNLVIATQRDISVSSHPGPSPKSESSKGNPAKAVSAKVNGGQSRHCEPLVRSVSSKSNVKKVVSLRQHDIGESSHYVPPNRSQLSKRSPESTVSVSQDSGEFSHTGSLDDSFTEEKSLQSAARAFLEKVAFQMVQDDSPGRNMELVQREEEDVSHSDSQQHEEDMQRAAKAFLAGINDSYSSKSDGELQSAARVFLQKQLFKPEKIVKTKYSWKKITDTKSRQNVPPASPGSSSMNMQLKNPRTFSKSSQSRQVVTSRFKIRKVPSLVNNTTYNSMSLSRPPTSGQKMAKVIASKYKLRKVYTQSSGTTKSSTSSKYRYRRSAPKSPTIFKPTVHPLLSISAQKRNMVKHNLSQTVVRTKYKIVKNSSLVEGENPLYKTSSRLPSRSKLKWVNKNSPQKVAQPSLSRRKVEPKSHTWNTRFSLKRPKGHRLSINQILGRSVKNLSQNKYKFIKAPTSTLNRRSALLTSKFLQRKLTHHLPAKNKLKIDRRGKSAGESQASSGQSKRLVVIGGMLYRSSRRKLTKAPPTGFKKVKRNVIIRKLNGSNMKTISVRGVKFKMDQGGKTLRRLESCATPAFSPSKPGAGVQQKRAVTRVDIGGVTYIQTKPGTLVKASTAKNRVLASRAVHRSIATATAARYKKNNLKKTKWKKYCMFFNRFGKCNRGEKCPYQHDPNRVAVCTRFLRGTCKVQDCPFSHKVAKEKMPVCLYFLRGVCSHDDCPYLHVNVNKDAKVCQDFIEGYCPLGDKCQRKHTLACPTFSRTGTCPEGIKCKMYHPKKKGQKRNVKGRRRSKSQSQGKETDISAGEGTSNANNEQGSSKDEKEPPAEEDDSDIPFKKRRLPSFISLKSEESSETKEKAELAGAPPLKIHPNLD